MRHMRTTPIFFALLLAACTGADPATSEGTLASTTADPTVVVGRIRAQEDSLFAKQAFDKRGALALLDVYGAFVKTYPQDTMAPEYLFRSAGLAKALGQPEQSVRFYDRIIGEYPGWRRIASTYYMKAFTIDDGLNEKGRAKQAYEEVIARFPDHPFAKDARVMIENLQYTDEELIQRFEQMQKDSVAAN